jgi:predicted ATP-dependent endonuclease of OLD family
MRLKLKSVELVQFRTVESDSLILDDKITVLVGANEAGKTTLLEAVKYLDVNNQFVTADTKINSAYARANNLPDLIYEFEIADDLRQKLSRYAKYFDKSNLIKITRSGNDFPDDYSIETVNGKDFGFPEVYENKSEIEQTVTLKNGTKTVIKPKVWTVSEIAYHKNVKLFKDGIFTKYSTEERDETLLEKITELILDELPEVFLWSYSDENYIPKDVPIDFYNNPPAYQSVINLFQLGGITQDKIASHLTGRDSVYVHNFLKTLSKDVTQILNNTWKQRKNIKLNLHFKDSFIEILVEEKDYQIDPKKRSEGLQWYFSFLINFRAKLHTLKDNLILFDQPGDKLHPGGQRDLLARFEEMSEENQIVYSTHTPFMIDKDYPERVRLITRPNDDTKIINKLTKKDIFEDELLRNSLGLVLSDIAPVAEKNVLVEGLLDKVIFLEFIEKLKPFKFKINLNNVIFIPANGASKVPYYANFIKSNGLSALAIFDNDTAGKNAIKEIKAKKILESKDILMVGLADAKLQTIEDLLPKKLVEESINEIISQYPGFPKIKLSTNPYMPTILAEFAKQSLEFDEALKFAFSIKVIEKFKTLNIDANDLKGELQSLFLLIKEMKKKIN